MKYTPEERSETGWRIYDGELSCRIAAEIYTECFDRLGIPDRVFR